MFCHRGCYNWSDTIVGVLQACSGPVLISPSEVSDEKLSEDQTDHYLLRFHPWIPRNIASVQLPACNNRNKFLVFHSFPTLTRVCCLKVFLIKFPDLFSYNYILSMEPVMHLNIFSYLGNSFLCTALMCILRLLLCIHL